VVNYTEPSLSAKLPCISWLLCFLGRAESLSAVYLSNDFAFLHFCLLLNPERWAWSPSRSDLSSTAKCDQNHVWHLLIWSHLKVGARHELLYSTNWTPFHGTLLYWRKCYVCMHFSTKKQDYEIKTSRQSISPWNFHVIILLCIECQQNTSRAEHNVIFLQIKHLWTYSQNTLR
jgi:hypothetical protein